MRTYTTTIHVGDDDVPLELEISYDITKPSRGARGAHGEQLEPDEEGGIDIIAVYLIPDAELLETLTEEIFQHLSIPNN
jgi:hypothetical protein